MPDQFQKQYFSFLLVATLFGCNNIPKNSSVTPQSDSDKARTELTQKPAGNTSSKETQNVNASQNREKQQTIQPGTYCYEKYAQNDDILARLVIDRQDRLTGDVQGTIHNEEAAYYSSYRQKINGFLEGNDLQVEIQTWIEYDQQYTEETWTITPDDLIMPNSTLKRANCGPINQAFQNQEGLEGSELIESSYTTDPEQVFFAAGESSATLSYSVVRGDRKIYLLSAQGGQQMELSIISPENNAVFDVIAPSGAILSREQTQESITLPQTGEYQVVVGGTRGNASFDLTVGIN